MAGRFTYLALLRRGRRPDAGNGGRRGKGWPAWYRALALVGAAALALAADTAASRAVEGALALGERRTLVPDLLVLTHVRNTGAAYGILSGRRWLLTAIGLLAVAAVPLLLRGLPRTGAWGRAGPPLAGLILGGALSNLVERAARGYVTDYLTMPIAPFFQVFNLADVAINVGVAGIVALSLFGGTNGAGDAARPTTIEGTGGTDGS